MEAPNTYQTLSGPAWGEIKEKGSKFISYACPVKTQRDIDDVLYDMKSRHARARHHCYAWRLIENQQLLEKVHDAGEPSGTAGKPILGQLVKFELFQVIIVVIRYFGGTKLGTSGLIRAYRMAARDAIRNGCIEKVSRLAHYRLRLAYARQPDLYTAAKALGIEILDTTYSDMMECHLAIPLASHRQMLLQLFRLMSGLDLENLEDYLLQMGLEIVLESQD